MDSEAALLNPEILDIDELTIWPTTGRCWLKNREVHLTDNESRILVVLARYAGKVVEWQTIRDKAWGPGTIVQVNNMREQVACLRKKIGWDRITVVRGIGLRLEIDPDLALLLAPLRIGDLAIDPDARSCWRFGQICHLSGNEFDALLILARRPGKVVSKRTLKRAIWGSETASKARLTTLISSLCKKIGRGHITSVQRSGYRLETGMKSGGKQAPLRIGDLAIDPDARKCWRADEELHLTLKEFVALFILAQRAGKMTSERTLKRCLWGTEDVSSKAVRTLVEKLRRKIGSDRITTVIGRGFRLEIDPDLALQQASVHAGDLAIDPDARKCWHRDRELKLTEHEFDILLALAQRAGKTVSKRALKDATWDNPEAVTDQTLKQHIKMLRQKIGRGLITTILEQGFRLEIEPGI